MSEDVPSVWSQFNYGAPSLAGGRAQALTIADADLSFGDGGLFESQTRSPFSWRATAIQPVFIYPWL
jgi:hypothetical protein